MKFLAIILLLFAFGCCIRLQKVAFQIAIEPFQINGLAGIQSFAYGQHDGKWLIIGGYGYSKSSSDHITYPYLTVLKV